MIMSSSIFDSSRMYIVSWANSPAVTVHSHDSATAVGGALWTALVSVWDIEAGELAGSAANVPSDTFARLLPT
jgi:hypothetical protein